MKKWSAADVKQKSSLLWFVADTHINSSSDSAPPLLCPTPPPPHPAPLTCCSVVFQPYRSFSVQRLTVGSARWRRCLKNKPEAQLEGHIKQNITGALRVQEEPISFPRYWACINFAGRITTFAVFVNSTEDIKRGGSVKKGKKGDQLFIICAEAVSIHRSVRRSKKDQQTDTEQLRTTPDHQQLHRATRPCWISLYLVLSNWWGRDMLRWATSIWQVCLSAHWREEKNSAVLSRGGKTQSWERCRRGESDRTPAARRRNKELLTRAGGCVLLGWVCVLCPDLQDIKQLSKHCSVKLEGIC